MTTKTDSLQQLFEQYSDALFRYAFFKLDGDRENALDLVQETYCKMGILLLKEKEIENPRAYLYRILSNLIIDSSRGHPDTSLDTHMEETGFDPGYEESHTEKIDAKMEVEKIHALLQEMKEHDKELFILRFVEEYSPQEIAEIYKKPVNAITVRLHRLKLRITAELTPNS